MEHAAADGQRAAGIAGLRQVIAGADVDLGRSVHVTEAGAGQLLPDPAQVLAGEGLAREEDPAEGSQVPRLEVATQRQLDQRGGHRVPHRHPLALEECRQAARHHQHRRRQDDRRRARAGRGVVVEGRKAGVMRRVIGQPVVARQRVLRRRPVHEAHRAVVGVQDQLRQAGRPRRVEDVGRVELDHRDLWRTVARQLEDRRPRDTRHGHGLVGGEPDHVGHLGAGGERAADQIAAVGLRHQVGRPGGAQDPDDLVQGRFRVDRHQGPARREHPVEAPPVRSGPCRATPPRGRRARGRSRRAPARGRWRGARAAHRSASRRRTAPPARRDRAAPPLRPSGAATPAGRLTPSREHLLDGGRQQLPHRDVDAERPLDHPHTGDQDQARRREGQDDLPVERAADRRGTAAGTGPPR